MNRVPVTAQCHHANIAVLKFFIPRAQLGWISQELFHGTMFRSRITARPNLDRLHAPAGKFFDHLIEGYVWERRIENSDRNLPCCPRGSWTRAGLLRGYGTKL